MIGEAELDPAAIARSAGSEFEYRYRALQSSSITAIRQYISRTRVIARSIAKTFDDERNAEWFIRSYLALKLVLSSTLLANTAIYARDHNLRAVQPYLSYYIMLNCCRAFIFSLPCVPWQGLATIEMTHSKTLNVATDKLKRLDADQEQRCGKILRAAKEQRDLFSYRFPATGLALFGEKLVDLDAAIDVARLFTELTQLNLACLEGEVRRNASGTFSISSVEDIWHTVRYEMTGEELVDDDDYRRVGYFYRKYDRPVALIAIATEGLVEDFFGAWHNEDGGGFDPDRDTDLLLDLL